MMVPLHLTNCESVPRLADTVPNTMNVTEIAVGCFGGDDCCSFQEHNTKCGLGEGSCFSDEDCEGWTFRKYLT